MKRFVLSALVLAVLAGATIAQTSEGPADESVKVELAELLTFAKITVVVGGSFIAVLAFIGVAFFGFDVRKARSSIEDATNQLLARTKEIEELQNQVLKDHSEFASMKSKFEGFVRDAQIQFDEFTAEAESRLAKYAAQIEAVADTSAAVEPRDLSKDSEETIRDVIQSSKFDWTSLQRLVNKTGYSRDQVLEVARHAADIEIGMGKKSREHIFRVKARS